MSPKIEKLFQVTFPREVYATEIWAIAVYRMRRNGGWRYCIVTSRASTKMPKEFDGLESFGSIHRNPMWHENWDDLVDDLNDYDWHLGRCRYCHPDYADRIWEQYLFWIGLTVEFWKHGLKPKEFYADCQAEAKEQPRSHLQLVHNQPQARPARRTPAAPNQTSGSRPYSNSNCPSLARDSNSGTRRTSWAFDTRPCRCSSTHRMPVIFGFAV